MSDTSGTTSTSPALDGVDVQVRDLVVEFSGITVLDEVSVVVRPGRLTCVVGPSGSGKTTLFNVLAGLQAPTRGAVDTAGARVGIVHQAFALLSLLTATENVELAAQIRGAGRDELIAEAAHWLAAVGLTARADHLVEELSGGEQQRVAIARAMMTHPQLLLADEPTAQLDPESRLIVLDLLRRAADAGSTVVIATHDAEVAARCDTVVELRSGRLVSSHDDTTGGRHRHASGEA